MTHERTDERRLRALRATELLDSPPEKAFDRLTRLAAHLLAAPVALVSLVDERRQFFKAAFGLREPWAAKRETPLSHSFCQHVTSTRAAFVVEDARLHPLVKDNLAIPDLDVVAYLGIPIVVDDEAIGAFCVLDSKPRVWSVDERSVLSDLAESVVSEIDLRFAMKAAAERALVTEALLESLGEAVVAVDANRNFIVVNAAARRLFATGIEVGQPFPADWTRRHSIVTASGTPIETRDGALGRALLGNDTDDLLVAIDAPGAAGPTWLEATGRAIRHADGKVVGGVSVFRDVTETKRQLELYRALAGNIPRAAVVLFDRDLRCLAIDGTVASRLGVPTTELLGQPVRAVGGYAEGDARFEPVDAACRRAIGGEATTLDLVHGDRILSIRTEPIRDGVGRVSSGIALLLDVTGDRRRAAALSKSEQIYRAIVQNLPNAAVLLVDRDLRYAASDGAALAPLLEYLRVPSLLGQSVLELANDATRDEVHRIYTRVLAGESLQLEVKRHQRRSDLRR